MEPEGDCDTPENSGMSYLETGPKPWALTPSLAGPDVFCTCAFPRPADMHTCLPRPQAHADGPLPQLATSLTQAPAHRAPWSGERRDDISQLAGAVCCLGREEAPHFARVLWLTDFTRFIYIQLRRDMAWCGPAADSLSHSGTG